MTTLDIKLRGRESELTLTAIHTLRLALEMFLTSEDPDTLLASLIELSIGLEVLLKRELDEKSRIKLSHLQGLDRSWRNSIKRQLSELAPIP